MKSNINPVPSKIQPPVLIAFEHLYSEYLAVKSAIKDEEVAALIEEILAKKKDLTLSWNDLYYLELILAKNQPVEKLRSKVIRLRFDYRSIAGQKEFDDYLASKPPDLQSPPEPTDPPHATQAHYEALLREDLRDLLGRIYLKYAILPVKEERLNTLTWYAARLCAISLLVLLVILAAMFFAPLLNELYEAESGQRLIKVKEFVGSESFSSLTSFVVVVSGALGGFVSALRRIQSPPSDGDSLYNLSLLFHGSKSVFVAPISGAIFATLLYLMFTAGILSGTFFPNIYTPEGKYTTESLNKIQQSSNTNNASSAQTAGVETETKTPTTLPIPKLVPKQGLNIFVFLAESSPVGGKDYALLIIWCFIAGFAERFVPDALDRLISRNNSANNGNS
jgi:hypothetical protein